MTGLPFYRNQEYLEKLKTDISALQAKVNELQQMANHSKVVLNSIKLTIIDLIQKLQDFDNKTGSIDGEINENTPSHILLQVKAINKRHLFAQNIHVFVV